MFAVANMFPGANLLCADAVSQTRTTFDLSRKMQWHTTGMQTPEDLIKYCPASKMLLHELLGALLWRTDGPEDESQASGIASKLI